MPAAKRKAKTLPKEAEEKHKLRKSVHGANVSTRTTSSSTEVTASNPAANVIPTSTVPRIAIDTTPTLTPTPSPTPLSSEACPSPSEESNTSQAPPPKLSQSTEALLEMVELLPELVDHFLAHELNADAKSTCSCGRGTCLVSCKDCSFYDSSCGECFIEHHRLMPFHWARVWDSERGFFRCSDISTLKEGYAIPLGHSNGLCANPQAPVKFVVTHSNGIHETRISFCTCFAGGSRVQQLMRAKLFPASKTEPISAFSFSVLKDYDIHSLQAKISVYDFCLALHWHTDNTFTHLVNDLYQSFMRIIRLWRFLKAQLRLGQVHGIDKYFPHCPPGALLVYCPSCPRPGENMEDQWWRMPQHLRHLNQWFCTHDGNHQLKQFFKNTNPFDESLYAGRSYFPLASEYMKYLKSLGVISSEEYAAHCNHVKVIANQSWIQGQNCVKSGAVNTQCDHVFVMATADMPLGERYSVVDASSHHGFKMQGFGDHQTDNDCQSLPCARSYNANCSYCVHVQSRFVGSEYLADQKDWVRDFENIIPDLHIKGHQDDCMVTLSHNYQWCKGHFHSETAEFYWVELNQVGGYTRQMNDGHQEDTIISHHHDWNWRKTVNAAHLTVQALEYTRAQVQIKTEDFRQLSLATPDCAEWSKLSCAPHLVQDHHGKKYHVSVYQRPPQATPGLKALLQHLAEKDSSTSQLGANPSSVEVFFRKAFDVECLQ